MKKIKLLSIVTLAGTLTLAGCGEKEEQHQQTNEEQHQHVWDDKWTMNETQHWVVATCHPEVCDHLGDHVDANSDGLCDVCGYVYGSTPTPDTPSVKSVKISGSTSLSVGKSTDLTATVTTIGTISNEVEWSIVEGDSVTLSNATAKKVTVTGVKDGTTKVKATSKADATKYAEVSIVVSTPDWSSADKQLMNEHLGIVLPYLGEGLDPFEYDEESDSLYTGADSFDCATAIGILEEQGYEISYYSYFGFIDIYSASKYLGNQKLVSLEIDDYGEEYGCELYAWAEVGTASWPTADVAEVTPKYMDYEEETIPTVSAEAYFEYEGSVFSLAISMYNATVTAEEYLTGLATNGWYVMDDPEAVEYYGGYICLSPNETLGVLVSGTGNNFTLDLGSNLPELASYPAGYINAFISEKIGSIYSVPALEGGDSYYYSEGIVYEDEDDEVGFYAATLYVDYNLKVADLKNYFETLKAAGFEGTFTEESDESYAGFSVEKGKICIEAYADTDYEEDYGETELIINYYAVDADEIPFELSESSFVLIPDETATLEATALEGFTGTFSFASSNAEVATVNSETGEITGVAKGTAEITATFVITEGEAAGTYTRKATVKVVDAATGVKLIAPETLNSGKSATLSYEFTPEESKGSGDVSYEILSGSEYATLVDNVLTAASDLEEEHDVEVKVTVGTFEATATITVVPHKDPITETISTFTKTNFTSEIGVKFEAIQGTTGLSAPAISSGQYRCYMGNQMTITAPEGHVLTCVRFTINNGNKTVCTVTADVGSFNKSTNTWTGEAEKVVLSFGSVSGSQFRIDSIYVELDGEGGDVPPSPVADTPESIISSIANALFSDPTAYDDDGYGGFITGVSFGDGAEEDLEDAVEYVLELISGIVEVDEYGVTEYNDEEAGLSGYEAYCYNEDESVEVNVYSFLEEGKIYVNIDAYEVE